MEWIRRMERWGRWFTSLLAGMVCQYVLSIVALFLAAGAYALVAGDDFFGWSGVRGAMATAVWASGYCAALYPSVRLAEWISPPVSPFLLRAGVWVAMVSWIGFVLLLAEYGLRGSEDPVLPHPWGWLFTPLAVLFGWQGLRGSLRRGAGDD